MRERRAEHGEVPEEAVGLVSLWVSRTPFFLIDRRRALGGAVGAGVNQELLGLGE